MSSDQVERLMAAQQHAAALGLLHSEAIAGRLGITATDLKCLSLLLRQPHTPRELADALRLTPSAITSVVDRMEKAGYVWREPSETDRRKVIVQVRPERAQAAKRLYTPLFERTKELLDSYDETQVATLLDFAERSAEILAESAGRLSTR